MSTVHHVPHGYHADLTSAEINRPLSELDAAIETVITTGSGTSTTLTAQASAGQASLTVASAAGFAPGDPIYLGTGAMFEPRIVATASGTTITVTVNLTNTYAIGNPISKSPVEIVAARGGFTTLGGRIGLIESRVIDVDVFGADSTGAADSTAAVLAARDSAGAGGGRIVFPGPAYKLSGTIDLNVPNKSWIIEGNGQGVLGSGTKIIWTGGALPVFTVGANARGCIFRDLSIDNTGTGTIGIQVDGCDEFNAHNVMVYPSVAFSTAAIALGTVTSVVSASFNRVYLRGNANGLLCGAVGAHLFAFGLRCIDNTVNDLILGQVGKYVYSAHFYGCTFENNYISGNPVEIYGAYSVTFDGCYFEVHDPANYAINIGSAAFSARGIVIQGCFISGTGGTYAINVNFASAVLSVLNNYFINYANPSYMVRNQNSARLLILGNDGDAYGMSSTTSFAQGAVTTLGNGGADRIGGTGIILRETTLPGAPGANEGHLFLVDNGAGKTVLKVRFASGAEQTIATEP